MANMSYCRFENTARDFRDCYQAFDALVSASEEGIDPLSTDELAAAKRLAHDALKFLQLIAEVAPAPTSLNDLAEAPHLIDTIMEHVNIELE